MFPNRTRHFTRRRSPYGDRVPKFHAIGRPFVYVKSISSVVSLCTRHHNSSVWPFLCLVVFTSLSLWVNDEFVHRNTSCSHKDGGEPQAHRMGNGLPPRHPRFHLRSQSLSQLFCSEGATKQRRYRHVGIAAPVSMEYPDRLPAWFGVRGRRSSESRVAAVTWESRPHGNRCFRSGRWLGRFL